MNEIRGHVSKPNRPDTSKADAQRMDQLRNQARKSNNRLERFSKKALKPLAVALTAVGVIDGLNLLKAQDQTIPQSAAELQSFSQNPWADKTREKLEGKTQLDQTDEKVEKVVLTEGPEGIVLDYSSGQGEPSDSIPVYDGYPSTITPDGPVKVLGRIKVGSEISNVLIVDGVEVDYQPGTEDGPKPLPARYIAFEAGDNKIIDNEGQPVELNPDQVLTLPNKYAEIPTPINAPQS